MKSNKLILLITLFCSALTMCLASTSLPQADSARIAYEKKDYTKAIAFYEYINNSGYESADLYYNLGNAYFKNNDIGMAILYYEKAKKLNPNDEDIITNLHIANQRTEDHIDAAPELFLTQWKNNTVDLFNETQWSIILIVVFALSLVLILIFVINNNKTLKQLGFYGGIIFFILSITLFFIAQNKYHSSKYSSEAIVISPSVNVTGSPFEKGTKLFILHEGTKVKITEENGDWNEIKIVNNSVGWVHTKNLKKI